MASNALKKFSIVVPTYNYAAVLPRAIHSVVSQFADDVELLVVDDGSTDDTPAVIALMQQEYGNVFRSIRKENGGPASARNLGIQETEGNYLIFLDADDELCGGSLDAFRNHLNVYPETQFIIGGHYSVSSHGSIRERAPGKLPETPESRIKAYLIDKTLSLSNGACVIRRDIFQYGLYPEHFRNSEDIPVFVQALARGHCTLLNQLVARIHKHKDSLRHNFVLAQQGGIDLVDEVFSVTRVPVALQALKRTYTARRLLSLFRTAYLAGNYEKARSLYASAFRGDWRMALGTGYLIKALRVFLWNRNGHTSH